MTPVEFLVILLGLLFGALSTLWLTRRFDLLRPNFRGERIPAVGGLVFVLCGEWVYAYEWLAQGVHVGSAAAYFLVTFGFGALGFWDDVHGDRSARGFRGHLGALRRGILTTGAAKAIGGAFVSVVAGLLLWYPLPLRITLAALLIALSANALNLLDLRPGRCLFAFFVGSAAVLGTLAATHALPFGFLFYVALAVALILYPLDAGGRLMLGDTGSNTFGAVLGVAGVLYFSPFWQAVLIILLLGFQLWCERHSLSQTIDAHPLLRRLDRKIGIREQANGP